MTSAGESSGFSATRELGRYSKAERRFKAVRQIRAATARGRVAKPELKAPVRARRLLAKSRKRCKVDPLLRVPGEVDHESLLQAEETGAEVSGVVKLL